jgi:hypothetical protein
MDTTMTKRPGRERIIEGNGSGGIPYTRHLSCLLGRVDLLCTYSHRTATKYLGIVRFAPQFFEGFNFTHLASQSGKYIFPRFFRVF